MMCKNMYYLTMRAGKGLMSFTGIRTTRFNLNIAATQMLVGLILFLQPKSSMVVTYTQSGGLIPLDSATLVGSGVLLLVTEQLRPVGPWRLLIGLMPAVPPAFSAIAGLTGGLWAPASIYALLAVSIIVGAVAGGSRQEPAGPDLWMLALGAVQATCGATFLLGGAFDPLGIFAPIHSYIRLAGVLGLISGGALLQAGRSRTASLPLTYAIGAAFPTLLAWAFWKTGFYAGMAAWGTWAAGLMVSPTLFSSGQSDAPSPACTGGFMSKLECLLESWLWLLTLCVVVTMADDGGHPGGALRSTIFVLAISAYNVLAFRVCRNLGQRPVRLRWHLSFVTLAVALLLLHSSAVGHGFLALLAAIPALGARAGSRRDGYLLMWVAGVAILIGGLATPHSHSSPMNAAFELVLFAVSAAFGLFVAEEHRRSSEALARRQAELEEALANARRADADKTRLAEVLEATPDFVGMSDASLRTIYLNRAAQSMVDLSMDEPVGDWVLRTGQFRLKERLEQEVLPALGRDGFWSGEDQIRTRTGEAVPISAVVIAHKDPNGEAYCFSYILRDIREQKHYEKQLIHLASYDPLTELFNRRRFCEELERHLTRAAPGMARGALIFIDVDQFKYVNDTLGHQAGDELLRGLADVLRQQVRRETDTVARLGGDEFAIILPGASAQEAQGVAERILERLRQHVPVLAGNLVSSTASIGVALYPDHGRTAADLLARADMAMYVSKDEGRNRVSVFEPDCAALGHGEQKIHWEQRIRDAIDHGRLTLYTMPIWSIPEGQVSHSELLLRMLGENGEVIAPGEFLPVAERFGLIQEIDRWVVTRAVQMVAEEARQGHRLVVEVNLSGRAFTDAGLLSLIQREIAAQGIDPASLIFEITETAAIADLKQAKQFIRTLRALGCRFAIDDFGSGYASFAYLKHLPVDYLKIDGSFITNLVRDPVDQHLVKSMAATARALGKMTIAEYVNDVETMRLLREMGVDFAQGYFVGRPVPYTQIREKTALPL